jgi:hypothetical protein
MSDTKIAASLRVSLTARGGNSEGYGRRVQNPASAWLHVYAARIEDAATGSADPVFDPSA